jgi:hypothetical protein
MLRIFFVLFSRLTSVALFFTSSSSPLRIHFILCQGRVELFYICDGNFPFWNSRKYNTEQNYIHRKEKHSFVLSVILYHLIFHLYYYSFRHVRNFPEPPIRSVRPSVCVKQIENRYATSRKVAGSIPDEAIGFFNWPHLSCRSVALGLTQPLTDMSITNLPGDKGRPARRVRLTTSPVASAGNRTPVVQPVAHPYTDWAIPTRGSENIFPLIITFLCWWEIGKERNP